MLLVVTPSSPKVVLHLRTRSYAQPPVAASLLAASASPAAATPHAAQLVAPPSDLSLGLGPGLGLGAGVGASAGPCMSDEDEEDGEGGEGGGYPRECPSAAVYAPTHEPGDEEAAGIRKRQRLEQRSEPSQAAHVCACCACACIHALCTCTAEGRCSGAWQTLRLWQQRSGPHQIAYCTLRAAVSTAVYLSSGGCDCVCVRRRPIARRRSSSRARRRRPGCRWREIAPPPYGDRRMRGGRRRRVRGRISSGTRSRSRSGPRRRAGCWPTWSRNTPTPRATRCGSASRLCSTAARRRSAAVGVPVAAAMPI